ncbi:MAG: DNA gyrase inhibitor YacG, partial [Burkholderiales bacterium]
MSNSSSRSATSDSGPGKKVVNCPQCGKGVVWDATNRFRPFCSERCKMIDLGA